MAQYPKTTGQAVTTKIKTVTQDDDGRMKLDEQLIEMMDILHPIGEVKFMMTDQVDPWIEKMARYNQVWVGGDGSLVKVSDYPRLFNDIGYKYGYSNTNPNGTYTYTFTDNNGNEKSLVIYNDLDIDGNAKAVPEGESPLYFRLPNLAGRFLRCAGTASYVNKWTDTDGTVRQLLTEYKAEMYKGQLDAQRGIYGDVELNPDLVVPDSGVGALFPTGARGGYPASSQISESSWFRKVGLDMSMVAPTGVEGRPAHIPLNCLLRLS